MPEKYAMIPPKTGESKLTRRGLLKLTAGGAALAWVRGLRAGGNVAAAGQKIALLPDERGATISPELFGYLIEPYGRTIEGIWVGEKSSIPNERGLRLDTVKALRRLGPTLVRYPGGTFADEYRWEDGIGPRAQRPVSANTFTPGEEEDNQFGTDEFLRFCELIEATAAIKVNVFTTALDDTLRWMEYCNYSGNTTLAKLRARNGHPKPYGVKYWQLGNEATDALSPEMYAELVHLWTFHMRQADQQAQLVVTGLNDYWNEGFLAKYASLLKHGGIATSGVIDILALKYADEEGIKKAVARSDQYLGPNNLNVAEEEWAAGGKPFLPLPKDFVFSFPMVKLPSKTLEYHVSMVQALSAAGNLHTYMRNAGRLKFASFLYPTNTWGALVQTNGSRHILTANYHAFDMLKWHKGGDLIGTEFDVSGGLDVLASSSKNRRQITLSLINNQREQSVEARLRLKGSKGGAPTRTVGTVLTGEPEDENSFEDPNKVKPREAKVEGRGNEWSVICEPFSLTVVTLGYGE